MLSLLLDIFFDVTVPITVLIALGAVGQRWQKLDAGTLNRLVLYVLLPPFLINAFAQPGVPLSAMGKDALAFAVQSVLLLGLGWIWGGVLGLKPAQRAVVAFGLACPNSINYGIPFVDLAMGSAAVPTQAIAGSVHSVFMMSVGIAVLAGAEAGFRKGLLSALKSPIFVALAIGLGLRFTDTHLPRAIAYPLALVGQGYAPIALVTLGVQLATVRLQASLWPTAVAVLGALLVAPAATWGIVWGLQAAGLSVSTPLIALLVVNAALPAGAGLAILGSELGKDRVLPTAMVVASTILSPFTLTVVVFLMRRYHLAAG
jgi:malate permease and related proteins